MAKGWATNIQVNGDMNWNIHRIMDQGFKAWYISRPIVGGIMGAFVGMITSVALVSENGANCCHGNNLFGGIK